MYILVFVVVEAVVPLENKPSAVPNVARPPDVSRVPQSFAGRLALLPQVAGQDGDVATPYDRAPVCIFPGDIVQLRIFDGVQLASPLPCSQDVMTRSGNFQFQFVRTCFNEITARHFHAPSYDKSFAFKLCIKANNRK